MDDIYDLIIITIVNPMEFCVIIIICFVVECCFFIFFSVQSERQDDCTLRYFVFKYDIQWITSIECPSTKCGILAFSYFPYPALIGLLLSLYFVRKGIDLKRGE